jgi:ATP-binding cassette subfamily B protein
LKDLHNRIGYVSQKAVMFSGTVESNITLGDYIREPEKADMIEAINIAQAKDFVESQDDLDKVIDQGGLNVSGGQKQRLSIARAVLRKPEICIFDDSFSALDYKTDKKLRDELSKKLKDTTCVIVAQRIGTIKNADQIVVLEDGVIVGHGKHKELLKNCDVYKEIALSQLNKEEL